MRVVRNFALIPGPHGTTSHNAGVWRRIVNGQENGFQRNFFLLRNQSLPLPECLTPTTQFEQGHVLFLFFLFSSTFWRKRNASEVCFCWFLRLLAPYSQCILVMLSILSFLLLGALNRFGCYEFLQSASNAFITLTFPAVAQSHLV